MTISYLEEKIKCKLHLDIMLTGLMEEVFSLTKAKHSSIG